MQIKNQAMKFEDEIGGVIDQFLNDGLDPDAIKAALEYQARYAHERRNELAEKQSQIGDAWAGGFAENH